jgi:hypothetical protein
MSPWSEVKTTTVSAADRLAASASRTRVICSSTVACSW